MKHIRLFFFVVLVKICLVDVVKGIDSQDRSKRILMHSDDDIATEITNLRAELDQLKTKQALQGSVYTRWGRNACPSNVETVYTGYTAGRQFEDNGSGVDTLCLPEDPVWGRYHDGDEANTVYRGYIYGTEVNTDDAGRVFSHNINDQDLPCAVCRTTNSVTVMIPARNVCYPGWTMEYAGYLVSGSTQHPGLTHICLDGEPDFVFGGDGNNNEHVLYLVEGRCGSLQCPPYVQGRELTCVVCSK